jgi:poly-gamma-glutamate synthesis protein (capsule biosynthesis protein)
MLTLVLIGDVMLGRGVDAALKQMQPQAMWGDVLPHL